MTIYLHESYTMYVENIAKLLYTNTEICMTFCFFLKDNLLFLRAWPVTTSKIFWKVLTFFVRFFSVMHEPYFVRSNCKNCQSFSKH